MPSVQEVRSVMNTLDSKSLPKMDSKDHTATMPLSKQDMERIKDASYSAAVLRPHTNQVIEAAKLRARDENDMQIRLQDMQYRYGIYNSDIGPEHETEYYCNCPVHQYQRHKQCRSGVQRRWGKAVMYPGEKYYDDNTFVSATTMSGSVLLPRTLWGGDPYAFRVVSPYGYYNSNMFRVISQLWRVITQEVCIRPSV